MPAITLPDDLKRSFLDYKSYPENLALKGTTAYLSKLKTYKGLLEVKEHELFSIYVENEHRIDVPYREFNTGRGLGNYRLSHTF